MKIGNGYAAGIGLFTFGMMVLAKGFRGIKWDSHINDLEDMEYWAGEDGIQYYTRRKEKLEFGSVKASAILYGFRKNRLKSVRVITGGDKNYEILKKAISRRFGPGAGESADSQYKRKHVWIRDASAVFLEMEKIPSSSLNGIGLRSVVTLTISGKNPIFEPAIRNRRVFLTEN